MQQKTEQEYLEMLKAEYGGQKDWPLAEALLKDNTPKETWEFLASY